MFDRVINMLLFWNIECDFKNQCDFENYLFCTRNERLVIAYIKKDTKNLVVTHILYTKKNHKYNEDN